MSFGARKVLNSKYTMYVSNTLPGTKKAINYYERQFDQALSLLNVPEGAELPRIVLMNSEQDMGTARRFGAYSAASNTVYIDARRPNKKSIIARLKQANESKKKHGYTYDWFAVADNELSPVVHELGHYQHYQYVKQYADKNQISFGDAKRLFNASLLDFMDDKDYNVAKDISEYASKHFYYNEEELNATNEIMSEAQTLSILKRDKKAIKIIEFLEKGDW